MFKDLIVLAFSAALMNAQQPAAGADVFKSILALEKAELSSPRQASIETSLAINYLLLEQRQLCKTALEKALEIDSQDSQANYLRGRLALDLEQDPGQALKWFQKTLEIDPASFKAHYYAGICLTNLGQHQAAKAELEKATGSTSYSWPFRALAETDLLLNAPNEALRNALRSIEIEPKSAENYFVAGKVYQMLGRNADAVKAAQEAARLEPRWDAPHFLLGKLYSSRADTRTKAAAELDLFQRLKDEDDPGAASSVKASAQAGITPQAISRVELDDFGTIMDAADPLITIRAGERFLSIYPSSDFRERVLEAEFKAFQERNDYSAVLRTSKEILGLNAVNALVLAESALFIANQNDVPNFRLAGEYADRSIDAVKTARRPTRQTRDEFAKWKANARATAYAGSGLLALRRKDPDAAVVSLTEAAKIRPEPQGSDYLRLGEALLQKHDLPRASEAFAKAESLGPQVIADAARRQNASTGTEAASAANERFVRALEQQKLGKLDRAADEYEGLLRDSPNLAEAWHNLGLTYYLLQNYERSAECLKTALRLRPKAAGSLLFLGLAQFRLGQFDDSAKQLQETLGLDRSNREATLFLLRDQTALGLFHPETIQEALRLFPNDVEVNYTVGLACIDRIREIARSANDSGPLSADFIWLSLRRAEQRRYVAAVQKYQDASLVTAEPPLIFQYDLVASILKKSFDAVLASDPNSSAAHGIRGYLHESRNEVDEAVKEYRRGGDHFSAGRLLAQNVRLPEAEEEFLGAVTADPQNYRAKADLGKLYLQEGQPSKALPILEEISERYPLDAYAWADLGKAQAALGDGENGVKSLSKALELDSHLKEVHYQLAMLYRKLGREGLVREELNKFQSGKSAN